MDRQQVFRSIANSMPRLSIQGGMRKVGETEKTEQEEECMNARRNLNAAYVSGSFLLAAVGGYFFQSWAVFILGLLIDLGLNLYDGGIRLDRRNRRR
jgi:hypothetical protein